MNHDLVHGNPGTTFSNILERDEYDPTRHAVVMLSTFREMLHKWVIDVYIQTPHRGIRDTPAHRWHTDMSTLPPPLPPTARDLDLVLGMTAQRVVFHYGIELEGLKYNGPELGELRRRVGAGMKVELTFDPGDLGHINVLDPEKGAYIPVLAIDPAYANGLSLWQHKVIRRYAQRQLNARTDIVALAQAKAEIRALVERDFNRKSTHGRKRHARFLEDHTGKPAPAISVQPTSEVNACRAICIVEDVLAEAKPDHPPRSLEVLRQNEQLRRRFGSTLRVSAFRWDIKEDRTTYRAFLRAVQDQLPEYEMPNLADLDLAFRMHYASYGLIGYTMKIIRGAARIASDHPRHQITVRTFSQSYADHIWSERLSDPNPFGEKFDCEKAPPMALPSATARIPPSTLMPRSVRLELHA